jgi:hypothetical protein
MSSVRHGRWIWKDRTVNFLVQGRPHQDQADGQVSPASEDRASPVPTGEQWGLREERGCSQVVVSVWRIGPSWNSGKSWKPELGQSGIFPKLPCSALILNMTLNTRSGTR